MEVNKLERYYDEIFISADGSSLYPELKGAREKRKSVRLITNPFKVEGDREADAELTQDEVRTFSVGPIGWVW